MPSAGSAAAGSGSDSSAPDSSGSDGFAEGARRAAAHVFVTDIDDPALDDDDIHHLSRVLRLRPGETVSVVDGRGSWRRCAYVDGRRLDPTGPVVAVPALVPALTVAFALTRGDGPDWTVQKLTELGIDTIIPLVTDRSVVRPDAARGERQLARWRKIVRQAAMQSRRLTETEITPWQDPAAVVGAARASVARAEPGGAPPTLERPGIMVGPEGGWSAAEEALAVPTVGLGPTILRVETAAITAGALLAVLRHGLLGPPQPVAAGW